MNVKETIQKLNAIDVELINYEGITKAAKLAVVTGEHMLLTGEPGTAKSLFVRKFFGFFEGNLYAHQCSKFDDETVWFGYPDMKKLKDDGVFSLRDEGLAKPGTYWMHPDELFDLNEASLRTTLGILNERIFMRGGIEKPLPLRTAIGTSNFLRATEQSAAVRDRFLFSAKAPSLTPQMKRELAANSKRFEEISDTSEITVSDLNGVLAAAIKVTVPEVFIDPVIEWAGTVNFTPRRLGKLFTALRVNALLEGRNAVDLADLEVCRMCLVVGSDNKGFDLHDRIETQRNVVTQTKQIEGIGKNMPTWDQNNADVAVKYLRELRKRISSISAIPYANEEIAKMAQDKIESLSNAHANRMQDIGI